ncbi:serine hydrolase [Sporosarcina sp. Te-1]|uniref:serine hydrolase domain-containing protein n=1 Tax=Sporosarcina sp. Te-1 TaxID=2818390 RepID=UPI001A9CEA59|nr:serine hydrolase domain-containing protein [Sporosarcina sp. Te-1]QTD42533.1 beta-lactamase family protein [Sporosarcina sp. Te-1]
MRRFFKIALISVITLAVLGSTSLFLFFRDNHGNLSGSIPEQIDQYLSNQEFQGAVLISMDRKVLFEKGYGMATSSVQNNTNTLYQIASLTKSFTAVAIMQLAEKQMLHIDDPIAKYFPDFPNADTITIGHLLSHSSGIPDYLKPDYQFDFSKVWEPNDLIEVVRNEPLEFTPGESFSYSNTGYVLLGLIIEQVSGQLYSEYIEEQIFKPSGMHDSMFETREGSQVAEGHVEGKTGPHIHNSAAYAAGNIISTAEDLALFDDALRQNLLVSEETTKLMGTTQASKFPHQHGYGWYTQDVMGYKSVGHSGGYPSGFRHYVTRLQDIELTIIVLSNEATVNSKKINRNLTSIVLQEPIWFWEERF